jgi:uncharacterized membrane protein YphA (DoxX/SURF4 family)
MMNLSNVGRIFYGIAMAGTGIDTIYFNAYPYYLLPPLHSLTPGSTVLHYITGVIFILAGAGSIVGKKNETISFLFGCLLLLIFCFFIPYQFTEYPKHFRLAEWENAEKELSLAAGAFIIAACFPAKKENPLNRFRGKMMGFGSVLFSIPIVSFGILHFQYASDVSTMVPSWIPFHLFWTYLAGIGLLGSGISIILKIKTRLIATVLGIIIFIWFVTIHVPGVITSSLADLGDQIASAFLALFYSGIAFVIAGADKKKVRVVAA